MKEKTLEKLSEEIKDWQYPSALPAEWFGYKLTIKNEENGDMYDLFTYENAEERRSATAYFHEETMEYKFRVKIGLTEFCQIQYINAKLGAFEKALQTYLEASIHDLAEFNINTLSYIMQEQKITEWDYKPHLPPVLEGFELYITPDRPVRVLNGSYIVFDYSDFSTKSNFIIYYNEFLNEFYGEARIKDIPEMNYIFDSKNLMELEDKLREHLVDRLKGIKARSV